MREPLQNQSGQGERRGGNACPYIDPSGRFDFLDAEGSGRRHPVHANLREMREDDLRVCRAIGHRQVEHVEIDEISPCRLRGDHEITAAWRGQDRLARALECAEGRFFEEAQIILICGIEADVLGDARADHPELDLSVREMFDHEDTRHDLVDRHRIEVGAVGHESGFGQAVPVEEKLLRLRMRKSVRHRQTASYGSFRPID